MPPVETRVEHTTLRDARVVFSDLLRFLTWELFYRTNVTSESGNRYVLVTANPTSESVAVFRISNEEAFDVSRKLLKLLLLISGSCRCRSGATREESLPHR